MSEVEGVVPMRLMPREPARDVSLEPCRKFKWRMSETREVVFECFTHGRYWPCDRGPDSSQASGGKALSGTPSGTSLRTTTGRKGRGR